MIISVCILLRIKMYDVRLQCPFTCIVSGASNTGKTTFIFNLLQCKDMLFTKIPARTILFYKKHQNVYDYMISKGLVDELVYIKGDMISESDFERKVSKYRNKGGSLCLFDDLLEAIDETNSKIFTKISHHENCSVIFLTQNLFVDNKHYRTMSKNATYMVLMKNPRNMSQIKNLSSQMCSEKSLLVNAYKEATRAAYSYLFIDFHPRTPEHIRLRSHILPHQAPMKVYLETNGIC